MAWLILYGLGVLAGTAAGIWVSSKTPEENDWGSAGVVLLSAAMSWASVVLLAVICASVWMADLKER